MHFAQSDYTPFAYERSLRSDRPAAPAAPATAATTARPATVDAGAAHRLLRSTGPVVEHKLSSLAKRWCETFDTAAQPNLLCLQYPRIANRLALCWADTTLTQALFSELMIDRRGDRKGFPPPVQAELRQLASLNAARCQPTSPNERTGVLRV